MGRKKCFQLQPHHVIAGSIEDFVFRAAGKTTEKYIWAQMLFVIGTVRIGDSEVIQASASKVLHNIY
jgi:hypothetical protein